MLDEPHHIRLARRERAEVAGAGLPPGSEMVMPGDNAVVLVDLDKDVAFDVGRAPSCFRSSTGSSKFGLASIASTGDQVPQYFGRHDSLLGDLVRRGAKSLRHPERRSDARFGSHHRVSGIGRTPRMSIWARFHKVPSPPRVHARRAPHSPFKACGRKTSLISLPATFEPRLRPARGLAIGERGPRERAFQADRPMLGINCA